MAIVLTKMHVGLMLNRREIMKPLLSLKTVVLLAYVALCTNVVLTVLEGEPAAGPVSLPYYAAE